MNRLNEIKKYIEISPTLSSGGQPSKEQLVVLCEEGVKLVINLGLEDADYAVEKEAEILAKYGVEYINIPVDFTSPTKKKLFQFFSAMQLLKNNKIFVHCAANKRASCFVGLWGKFFLGWSKNEVDEYISNVWEPDQVWSSFMDKMVLEIGNHS